MAARYRFGDSSLPHFITFAVVNWIDVFTMLAARVPRVREEVNY